MEIIELGLLLNSLGGEHSVNVSNLLSNVHLLEHLALSELGLHPCGVGVGVVKVSDKLNELGGRGDSLVVTEGWDGKESLNRHNWNNSWGLFVVVLSSQAFGELLKSLLFGNTFDGVGSLEDPKGVDVGISFLLSRSELWLSDGADGVVVTLDIVAAFLNDGLEPGVVGERVVKIFNELHGGGMSGSGIIWASERGLWNNNSGDDLVNIISCVEFSILSNVECLSRLIIQSLDVEKVIKSNQKGSSGVGGSGLVVNGNSLELWDFAEASGLSLEPCEVGSTVFKDVDERLSNSELFLNIVWALGEDGWDIKFWIDDLDHIEILEVFELLSGVSKEVEEGDIGVVAPHGLEDSALVVDTSGPLGEVGHDEHAKVFLGLSAGQEDDGGIIDSWSKPLSEIRDVLGVLDEVLKGLEFALSSDALSWERVVWERIITNLGVLGSFSSDGSFPLVSESGLESNAVLVFGAFNNEEVINYTMKLCSGGVELFGGNNGGGVDIFDGFFADEIESEVVEVKDGAEGGGIVSDGGSESLNEWLKTSWDDWNFSVDSDWLLWKSVSLGELVEFVTDESLESLKSLVASVELFEKLSNEGVLHVLSFLSKLSDSSDLFVVSGNRLSGQDVDDFLEPCIP